MTQRYYSLGDGEAVVWVSEGEAVEALAALQERVEASITPCYHSLEQFKQYLTETLKMEQAPLEGEELERQKAIYIVNHYRHLLTTPEKKTPKDRYPTEAEIEAWCESLDQRFQEALAIPLETVPIRFSRFVVQRVFPTGHTAEITVLLEEHDYYYEVGLSCGRTTQEEQEALQACAEAIRCYKGVTAEDIQNRTAAFQYYVRHLLEPEMERLLGALP